MLIIGIDPWINGAICLFKDGKIVDVFEMPKIVNSSDGTIKIGTTSNTLIKRESNGNTHW